MMGRRTLVIGDIHGQYDELLQVLDCVGYSASDSLVFLGDYLNRGRKSKEVMQFLTTLKQQPINVFLRETAITHEVRPWYCCHAGLEAGLDLDDQGRYSPYFLVWGDEAFLDDEHDYGKTVVFGHYHLQRPMIGARKVGIALQDAVAVFDLDNLSITDSNGRTISVSESVASPPSR